jgi:hypothetical protein
MSNASSPMRIWCLVGNQTAHVKPVEHSLGAEAEFLSVGAAQSSPEAMLAQQPDLLLCVNDYPYEVARCIDAAREAGIPSLVLQDGILEWRCQYENPLFGAGGGAPQHQPVLADKIACLGAQSVRQIAAWGNPHKVEDTGMPRLDYLLEREPPPIRTPGTRLMVMTAKNHGFTPEQREITVRSIADVRDYLATRPDIEVVWRVNKEVAQILGLENQLQQHASTELTALLEQVDAVITTISTTLLESMLLGRPVAALDYHNVPRFVQTAWSIPARDYIGATIDELLNPPARKMAYQRECLHDTLTCDGPAAPRVAELVRKLVAEGRAARAEQTALRLSPALLEPAGGVRPAPSNGVSLRELYPDQEIYADTDVQSLQVRLARLQKHNEELQRALEQRGIRHGIYQMGRQVATYLRTRNARKP